MRWIVRAMLLIGLLAILIWGQDKAYGMWSLGFLLAAILALVYPIMKSMITHHKHVKASAAA